MASTIVSAAAVPGTVAVDKRCRYEGQPCCRSPQCDIIRSIVVEHCGEEEGFPVERMVSRVEKQCRKGDGCPKERMFAHVEKRCRDEEACPDEPRMIQ